jgi:hypothetical protein
LNIHIFIVIDFNIESLIKTQDFLFKLFSSASNDIKITFSIVYNKAVNAKMKYQQIEQDLMFWNNNGVVTDLLAKFHPDDFFIPFYLENYILDLNNKLDGVIEDKDLTRDVKKVIKAICDKILS